MRPEEASGRPPVVVSRAIIFDLDGTVVDSHLAIEETRQALLALLGGSALGADGAGGPAPSLSELLRQAQGRGPDAGARAMGLVDAMEARAIPTPMPGAREVLRRLGRERDLGIGLLTNSGRDGALGLLERLDMGSLFDVVLCREDVPALKPSPHGLERMVARMGGPARVLYVGDSWIDARAARDAGVSFVAFRLSDNRLRARGLGAPQAHAEDWSELSRVLGAWLSVAAAGAGHGRAPSRSTQSGHAGGDGCHGRTDHRPGPGGTHGGTGGGE